MLTQLRAAAAAVAVIPMAGFATGDAVDLSTIERSIATEPAYETGEPTYCLLVFGNEAATRMWLVLDGDVLYADLDGDGDLTDADERLTTAQNEYDMWGQRFFKIDRVREAAKQGETTEPDTHSDLQIAFFDGDEETMSWLSVTVNGKRRQSASAEFTDKVAEAPIVHFNGPLQARLSDGADLTLSRSGPTEVYIEVGTPGLGDNTFASINYSGIPTSFQPQLAMVFPAAGEVESPVEQVLILPGRC